MKNRRLSSSALLYLMVMFGLVLSVSGCGSPSPAVPVTDGQSITDSLSDARGFSAVTTLSNAQGRVTPMVAAGSFYSAGLRVDGTVVVSAEYMPGWTNIIQVAIGYLHIVGLKADGTVVAVLPGVVWPGEDWWGECNVGGWTDIVQVAAGNRFTIGLRADGTVVAVGCAASVDWGQCDVAGWTDIIQVSAVQGHTVGLRADGTVVAVGDNRWGQCDVAGWTDIIQVAADWAHTVGLRSDGTVVAAGFNDFGQCNVGSWTDIVQIAAGRGYTVGLRNDGTVVAAGINAYGQCNTGSWTDIVQIAATGDHTVGLRDDCAVVAVGENTYGQCDVDDWDLCVGLSSHSLTVSSTDGGSVAQPGEATFTYEDGSVVDLVATPAIGHHFVNWTGDVGTVGIVDSAETTITMNGDYAIVANFEPVAGVQSQCVRSATSTGEVCLTTSHGFIENLRAIPPHSLPSVLFPHGMFDFKITGLTPGQTVTLTIEFPSPLPIGTLWWKYDNGRWHGLPNESDNGDNIMVITLTDGGTGDLDKAKDGVITDPGGPGNPMTVGWDGTPVHRSSVVAPWIAFLATAIAATSLLAVMRRNRSKIAADD